MKSIDNQYKWKRLSPTDAHYFFGYYDRCPWSKDDELHLCLKVGQAERIPEMGEQAEIGYLKKGSESFTPLTTTRAWCHQQGAMTLWLEHKQDCFVFNDWDESKNKLIARIVSLKDGVVGGYSRPLYAISPDGKWGASLNFARIPRRGYSYADAVLDKSPCGDGDGIYMVNLETGEDRLIISYSDLLEIHPAKYMTEEKHLWLNHIGFNCDSSRIQFLFRHCAEPEKKNPWPWQTFMYTANIDGSDLRCPINNAMWNGVSHQIWGRSPNEMLLDANWQGTGSEYVVFDEQDTPLNIERISTGMGPMGHLIFSPDGKSMLADTYAVDGVQKVARVDCATGDLQLLGSFSHTQPDHYPVDVRCDLHPRWNRTGTSVTVDSIHEGRRAVYYLEL